MSRIRLFCIPFAGGSALSFSSWMAELKEDIQVIPIELSGKGTKVGRKSHDNFPQALEETLDIVKKQVPQGGNYALFGHSMGALLAFELYHESLKAGLSMPEYIVLSAAAVPDRFSCKETASKSLPEFEDCIGRLGGLPTGIMKNRELKETVLKTIKKDYEIMATYSYLRHEPAIECSGYILRGAGDRMTAEDLPEHWGKFFHKPVKFITVEGSHFFINESFAATLDIIKKINSKNI